MASDGIAFPQDSPWNQDIRAWPVAPDSDRLIAFIGAGLSLKADFGSGLWEGAPIGIPFTVVSGKQPSAAIHYTAYGAESDPGPMPIPVDAPIEGGAAGTGDRHVLAVDWDRRLLFELYKARPRPDGAWDADSGAVWDLDSAGLRPWGWTSADAAGLPIFPGLVRYQEVASGSIRHALRFTAPRTRRAFVAPATHWASSDSDASAPPMGLRVRLKASVDLASFGPRVRVILEALKRYGMILADNGSAWYVSGAPDDRWDNDELRQLARIKGADLEAVASGPVHVRVPKGAEPLILSFSALPAVVAPGEATTLVWSASGAERFFLVPGPGLVKADRILVSPGTTTTYTLTAQGPFGSAQRRLTVVVR